MLPLVHWYFRWAPHQGSQLLPNAGRQARREAGAQRTLYAVACMPLFGQAMDSLGALYSRHLCTHCPNAAHLGPNDQRGYNRRAQAKQPNERETPKGQDHTPD